jgi:hypothetical protein
MNWNSAKLLALLFAFALVLGTVAALAPATAQASDMAGPPHPRMHGYHRHFTQEQMTNPFVRDVFDGKCQWWQYELKHGRYVRTYSPCKYGDAEISYRVNGHLLWSQPGINNGNGDAD